MAENGRYITVEEAQQILRVSVRQVHNHIASGRIRSQKEGKRRMLVEDDVIALAAELGSANREPPQSKVEMLPDTGPLIDYIRDLNNQALIMSRRIGELEAQLQQRLLPEDAQEIREQLTREQIRAQLIAEENERLRQELAQAQQRTHEHEAEINTFRQYELERARSVDEPQSLEDPPETSSWWKRLFGGF